MFLFFAFSLNFVRSPPPPAASAYFLTPCPVTQFPPSLPAQDRVKATAQHRAGMVLDCMAWTVPPLWPLCDHCPPVVWQILRLGARGQGTLPAPHLRRACCCPSHHHSVIHTHLAGTRSHRCGVVLGFRTRRRHSWDLAGSPGVLSPLPHPIPHCGRLVPPVPSVVTLTCPTHLPPRAWAVLTRSRPCQAPHSRPGGLLRVSSPSLI